MNASPRSATGLPLLRVENLTVRYRTRRSDRSTPAAVSDVSFSVAARSTYAIVGESGSGKTTTGKAVTRLVHASAGRVIFDGLDIRAISAREFKPIRPKVQMVFQDPHGSLDPRQRVGSALEEVVRLSDRRAGSAEVRARVAELFEMVGLSDTLLRRYPRELSGGQAQRIGLARALARRPSFLVLDEPTSALDVSVQAQVINLLAELQSALDLSFLFISHNLAVVGHIADHVAVMFGGRIVEQGLVSEVFDRPRHPYTDSLLLAAPIPDVAAERARNFTALEALATEAGATRAEQGCPFRTRCPRYRALGLPEACASARPELTPVDGSDRTVACHFPVATPGSVPAVAAG
jgi:oligopeptide/dipeptide ABC transporter ATP-binding protein